MADDHTGGMIALVPANAADLAVPGGDPVDELHLTLAYLGDDVSIFTQDQRDALVREVMALAARSAWVTGNVFAHSLWNVDSDQFDPATVYEIGGADWPLQDIASAAQWVGERVLGTALFPRQHFPFKPHVTAGFGTPITALTYTGEVQFHTIRLALGPDVYDYPLAYREDLSMTIDTPERSLQAAAGDVKVPVEFPVVIVEGMETSDHRYIEPGALGHRALPLNILAQTQNPVGGQGHDGAYIVGQIEKLERVPGPDVLSRETGEPFPEGTFVWQAEGWVNPNLPGAELVTGSFNEESGGWEGGVLIGNSADLSEVEAEFQYAEGDEDSGQLVSDVERISIVSGKIAATTLCSIPAFADAYVVVGGVDMAKAENRREIPTDEELAALDDDAFAALFDANPPDENPEMAGRLLREGLRRSGVVIASAFRSADLGDDVCLPCSGVHNDGFAVSQAKRDKAEGKGHAMPGGRYPIETPEDLAKAIKAVGRAGGPAGSEKDRNAVRKHIIAQAKRLGADDQIPSTWNKDGTLNPAGKGMKASATPLFPPIEAFTNPDFGGPVSLTVEDDGRVYGHLAVWGTCHTGFGGQCVQPPHSATDYAYFNVGAVRVLDGDTPREVAVGHITMGEGGHADTGLSLADAAAHYDNTNTVVADVAAGEDAHGIWVAGMLRHSVTPAQVQALRASPLSGDWRSVGGSLELVAALAVNTPGFPVPRARVASGAPIALTAAGVVPQPVHTDPSPKSSGAVILDCDQLADAIAERLRGRVTASGQAAEGNTLGERFTELYAELDADALASRMAAVEAAFADSWTADDAAWHALALHAELDGILDEVFELRIQLDKAETDLAKKKGNWVERAGGLPKYIKRITKHLQEKGMDESRAIATAVNAAKKMCSTGDVNFPGKQQVNPGSQAEACAAVADWEAKKAKSKAKSAVK